MDEKIIHKLLLADMLSELESLQDYLGIEINTSEHIPALPSFNAHRVYATFLTLSDYAKRLADNGFDNEILIKKEGE